MQIQTHIITSIPVFEVDEPLEGLVQFFVENTYSHVAIVHEKRFIGVFNENDLESFDVGRKIEDFKYSLESFFVRKDTSWFDVLETFARNEANLVPVLGAEDEILGYYDITDIVSVFIEMPFFTEPGGILVVSKELKDYSFSEIVQIVESNNSKFIGGFISEMNNEEVQITIKISGESMNEVLQTFRRYNYSVLFGNVDDQFIDDLKQRSDYLNKYLNV
ncbi:acetoin utilization protein acuB [Maribacter sp. TH_r10]|uniref:Acetoin utilization protein acuB n=1 Tax=Maribacter luteus TaxID=2594478 RepID=A0A6I2MMC3_9FLAO|nr:MULTISPECIES: CBS domain-containing protein [Maribacter]MDV7140233.1 acetoin utilization protein acuB [Maribacter sp. TH_r10]MRX63304.1 acetoin utilization protein acuB [Maribacter luteus]